jgi:hypothetical protein
VTHKSKSDAPVIFFGTSEIAWIGAKDVASWDSGMAQSFHNKGRKNKKFVVALEQVRSLDAPEWYEDAFCRALMPPCRHVTRLGQQQQQQQYQQHIA